MRRIRDLDAALDISRDAPTRIIHHPHPHPDLDILREKIAKFLTHEYEERNIYDRLCIAERIAISIERNYDWYDETLACIQSANTYFFVNILAQFLRMEGGDSLKSLDMLLNVSTQSSEK